MPPVKVDTSPFWMLGLSSEQLQDLIDWEGVIEDTVELDVGLDDPRDDHGVQDATHTSDQWHDLRAQFLRDAPLLTALAPTVASLERVALASTDAAFTIQPAIGHLMSSLEALQRAVEAAEKHALATSHDAHVKESITAVLDILADRLLPLLSSPVLRLGRLLTPSSAVSMDADQFLQEWDELSQYFLAVQAAEPPQPAGNAQRRTKRSFSELQRSTSSAERDAYVSHLAELQKRLTGNGSSASTKGSFIDDLAELRRLKASLGASSSGNGARASPLLCKARQVLAINPSAAPTGNVLASFLAQQLGETQVNMQDGCAVDASAAARHSRSGASEPCRPKILTVIQDPLLARLALRP